MYQLVILFLEEKAIYLALQLSIDNFRLKKTRFSKIEFDKELQKLETIDTKFENWILIEQELPNFDALYNKEITDL